MLAQLAAAVALIAAVTMPGWSDVSPAPVGAAPVAAADPAPLAAPVAAVAPVVPADTRPAHLNLDLRHKFGSVDLTVTVDGKAKLDTKLEGAGRKFGFGARPERQFTRSLELEPGVRVVRLRVRSADDKFDHTRVERFELDAAAVATMRIGVDKAGLDVMTDRPPVPAARPVAAPPPAPVAAATLPTPAAPVVTNATVPQTGMVAELYQTLRRLLIALAGFIASVAAAYLFEEFLRSRNVHTLVAHPPTPAPPVPAPTPRRRIAAE